eukprot:104429-Pelagomonas_calceolata.AAC.1
MDPGNDLAFYEFPRLVTHVDNNFLAQVTQLYRELIPPGQAGQSWICAAHMCRTSRQKSPTKSELMLDHSKAMYSYRKDPLETCNTASSNEAPNCCSHEKASPLVTCRVIGHGMNAQLLTASLEKPKLDALLLLLAQLSCLITNCTMLNLGMSLKRKSQTSPIEN